MLHHILYLHIRTYMRARKRKIHLQKIKKQTANLPKQKQNAILSRFKRILHTKPNNYPHATQKRDHGLKNSLKSNRTT